ARAVRRTHPRTLVGLVPGQYDLAAHEQLTTAEEALAGEEGLRVVGVVAAPRGVHGVHLALAEPEPRRPRVQDVRRVVAGAPLAVLPEVDAWRERAARGDPLMPPASG